jgi:hypothetical protein
MKTQKRNNMKKSRYLIRVVMILLGMAGFSMSCTKLDETLYSTVTPGNFFKTDAESVAALGAAYTTLGGYASGSVTNLQELTTDEMVVPTRGSDWDDGGNWRRLHLHSYKFEDNDMGSAWDFCYNGISKANYLIETFQSLAKSGQVAQAVADSYASELQTLRGFYYWQLIDLYGNVPLVTQYVGAPSAPTTAQRADVYNFVVTDLETAVPLTSMKVDGTTYGRMNYYAGKTLLAKLYLNAGVYTGTPQWQKVIDACDAVITSGFYNLESNYFNNFAVNNAASKEFIFAIPYDQVFFTGFNLNAQTLHYGSQFTYNLTFQPWNGFCSMEKFYNSYDATDLRKGDIGTPTVKASKRGNFLAGYQFTIDGKQVTDDGADANDPDAKPLNFGNTGHPGIPQINELGPQAWRQSGVRIGKWEFQIGGTSDMSNDLAVFRYADVLLMKAEAEFRLGNTAAALPLVNQIRERAGLTDLTSLDGAVSFDPTGAVVAGGELFNEMGREMFAEHNRRQDLIRWGFYNNNDKWALPFHNVGDVLTVGTDDHLKIYPIAKAKLSANPNLIQNPGY